MCIVLISTAHPDYALVLINNRDEYLNRRTAPAAWWTPPNEHILGGRDLLRKEQGTWLGITKQGRLAVLTNFKEDTQVQESKSRGAMVNAFLTQSPGKDDDTCTFVKSLVGGDGLKGVGGFSLVCGTVGGPLAVVSNRTPSVEGMRWLAEKRGETVGLSNAAFGDRSWPKVLQGEKLMASVIAESVARKDSKSGFVEAMIGLLSVNTLPGKEEGQGWESYVKELRKSIFIPVVGGDGADEMAADDVAAARTDQHTQGLSGVYGTQKQTVVLVDHHGRVTFVERTLYGNEAREVKSQDQDRWFEFRIEEQGWGASMSKP